MHKVDFLGEFNDKIGIDRSTAVMDTSICAFEIPVLPIIEQDTVRIDRGDSVEDMVRYGRDLKKPCWRAACATTWNAVC